MHLSFPVAGWFFSTQLAWLPSYFIEAMGQDLMHASTIALLPPLAGSAVSAVCGPLADGLIARGVPIPVVRKGAQSLAMLFPAAALTGLHYTDDPVTAIALITAAKGIANFILVG